MNTKIRRSEESTLGSVMDFRSSDLPVQKKSLPRRLREATIAGERVRAVARAELVLVVVVAALVEEGDADDADVAVVARLRGVRVLHLAEAERGDGVGALTEAVDLER